MAAPTSGVHQHWSSRLGFLMASVGFAVGLGNIWRFPYITGENGGSAFVLIYLLCAFCIGVPLLMTELMIGRRGGLSPISTMRKVADNEGASRSWGLVGMAALLAVFLIEVYYVVIAGWTLDYLFRAVTGGIAGLTAEQSQQAFDSLMASPYRMALWQGVIVFLTAFIVGRGLSGGIEKAVKILMPILLISIVLMVIYAAFVGDMGAALSFLFTPDFSAVTANTFLIAVGQAFFSIGIAMGTIMTYGAYLDRSVSIPRSAFIIVSADTFVALFAGLAIFPIVFGFGLEAAAGEGLVFVTLPVTFGALPGGEVFGALFFFLLFAAALTSCIGNYEPLISWAEEHRDTSRRKASYAGGFLVWILGAGTIFSFGSGADFHPLDFLPVFDDMTIYRIQDFVSANLLLPIGAIAMAIFAGWIMSRNSTIEELGLDDGIGYKLWRMNMRYIAPLVIFIILVFSIIGA